VANSFIKAEQVIAQMLGVLERETVLASLVWRDPVPTFRGAKNDTVSIRLPAYTSARTRQMRSNTALTIDELDETKVDVSLDTHVYKAIGVTDEEMTLDIVDFGQQITAPAMNAVVRKVDDALATEMAGADYEVEEPLDEDDPYLGILAAKLDLDRANVPFGQRFLAVGSNVEQALLASDRLTRFDSTGDGANSALREAQIGKIASFTAVSVPGLDPDVAVAAHRTAFVLCLVAPVVPTGASWGETRTHKGMSLRVLRDYDPTPAAGGPPKDRLLTDTFMGTGVTADRGELDADGRFVPTEDGTDDPIVIRAVKLTLGGS
jgi:hypothetical protein